jgi:hypothetical protein
VGGEGRSLFDFREKVIGFVGDEGRSLFDVGIGDRFLWVVWGDRYLMLRFRRSGFMGVEGTITVGFEGIGDLVCGVRSLFDVRI